MKSMALAATAALLAACHPVKTHVEYTANMDLAEFTRIAVMPFSDQKGRGRQISEAIAKGLPSRGFEVPDQKVVEAVFHKVKPDSDFGLTLTALTEIKQQTKAQAILAGAVSPNALNASVILLDAETGDEIFKGVLIPPHKGPFKDGAEIAEQALTLFAELPKRAQ